MRCTIEVTQDDIYQGVPEDACSCPVALATARALNVPNCDVTVTSSRISFWRYNHVEPVYCETPEEVIGFVKRFDEGQGVHPFHFEVDFPEED